MKKVALLLLLGCVGFASAQARFGLTAGLTGSNVSNINPTGGTRYMPTAGVNLTVPIDKSSNKLFFVPQVELAGLGERKIYYSTETYGLNYVAVPVLLKYYVTDRGGDFFIGAGPKLGFISSSDEKNNNTGVRDNLPITKFDVAATAVLGYSIRRSYEVQVRYDHGVRDVFPTYTGKNTNQSVSVNFTYVFGKPVNLAKKKEVNKK